MGVRVLACALLLLSPARASAEWQIKPFLGVTFGGRTTLTDLEFAVGDPNVAFGISGVLLGNIIGVEGDIGYAPGFFQSGDEHLVVRSSSTTLTGNIVIALPRDLTEYSVRPYFVGGGGLIHASSELALGVPGVASTLPALDFGGGLTGFLSKQIGVSWDVRYFRSIGRGEERGQSFVPEQLSFWRATMALAIRY